MDFSRNALLSRLSKADRAVVRSACRPTVLRTNEILSSPEVPSTSVYFLTGAVVALLMSNSDGPPVAVGLAGSAGVVGLQLAVGGSANGFTALVQSQGTAWSIDGDAFKRLTASRLPLLLAVARHLWQESEEFARYAEDLQRQSVTQRLARWILKSQGQHPGTPLQLTHIHLATMLGVRRASVSVAAVELRDLGLLDYARGKISVLDQDGLEVISRAHRGASPGT